MFTFILQFPKIPIPLRFITRRSILQRSLSDLAKTQASPVNSKATRYRQPKQRTCPDGGIGRRAGLKHQWSNPCRFDPGSGYKQKTQHYAGSFCLYPFSTPVSCADSPFQGHTAFRSRSSRASPLLRFSAKILPTRMTRR